MGGGCEVGIGWGWIFPQLLPPFSSLAAPVAARGPSAARGAPRRTGGDGRAAEEPPHLGVGVQVRPVTCRRRRRRRRRV
jgi:hypothetical protein